MMHESSLSHSLFALLPPQGMIFHVNVGTAPGRYVPVARYLNWTIPSNQASRYQNLEAFRGDTVR
jgi:hypothetical protein